MKWVIRIVLALVLLLAVAIVCVMIFVGDIIKTAVETVVPDVIGAPVTVEKVSVHPLAGTATIKGLVVGSPEGFNAGSTFEMDRLHVALDMGSLRTDKVIVNEITISAPRITYEGSLRGSNIGKILKNLEGEGGEEAPAEEPAAEEASGGKKVQIDLVLIEDGKVKLALKELGGRGATLPLPKVEVRDIGKGDSEVTFADAVARIVKAIATSVTGVVKGSGELLKKGAEVLNDGVGAAAGALGSAAGEVTGVAGDAVKGVTGAAGDAAKGLGDAAGKLTSGAGEGVGAVGDVAGDAAGAVGHAAGAAAGAATEGVKDATKALGAGASKLGDGVKGLFGGKKDDE